MTTSDMLTLLGHVDALKDDFDAEHLLVVFWENQYHKAAEERDEIKDRLEDARQQVEGLEAEVCHLREELAYYKPRAIAGKKYIDAIESGKIGFDMLVEAQQEWEELDPLSRA